MTKKDPGLQTFGQEQYKNTSGLAESNPSKPYEYALSSQMSDKSLVPESLYLYSLGLREIQAKSIQYGEKQAYVTKPLPIPGNVMEVQLEASEDHPLFDELSGNSSSRQTSVEYYLSYKQKPGPSDWIPILPMSEKTIKGERLMPDVNGSCTLRFAAKMTSVRVYANGLLMSQGHVLLLDENRLTIQTYDAGSIYTVDYEPDSYRQNPWTFKLSDYKKDVIRAVERFENGTAYNKTVTLEHSPFIDLSRMRNSVDYNPNTDEYKPISVYLKDASIQGEGNILLKEIQPFDADMPNKAFTYNRTLYEDKSWSELKPYDLSKEPAYKGFDYYQWKNKVTFTEHFNAKNLRENLPYSHGNATIEVHYDALITSFRLKMILRRNSGSEKTVTPKVNDYTLHFKTIQ